MNVKAITRNPWTTVGGALMAIGMGLQQADPGTVPEWLRGFGTIFAIVGPILIGFAARDSSTSSETAGAK